MVIKKYIRYICKAKVYFKILKHALFIDRLNKIPKADVLLVCTDGDRSFIYEGKKYSPLLDSINEKLIKSGIITASLSLPITEIKSNTAYGNVFSINSLIARARIKDSLFRLINEKNHGRNNYLLIAWSKIIEKTQAKIIIGIQPPSELCIAAKLKNICVNDLQHGILSNEGYYGLAYRKPYGQTGWPDYILCWNESSAEWIHKNLDDFIGTKVIGHPWISRFMNPSASDMLVNKYLSSFSYEKKSSQLIILISLQPAELLYSANHELGIPLELIKVIKESKGGCQWWIRIHPVMLHGERRFKTFASLNREFENCSEVHWNQCTDLPLALVLQNVDLHITSSSAVTIEASWFGIKTALLSKNTDLLKTWLGKEIDNGTAEIIIPECKEINRWINSNSTKNIALVRQKYVEKESIDHFISSIIEDLYYKSNGNDRSSKS